jgi:hypothetical protein
MKRFALIGMWVAVLAVGIMGCNWETGEDATSWSSSYNWVNFSGSYRGVGGGLLVTDYTSTPTIPGVTNIYSATESGGSMPARGTKASGKVSHGSIVPGSVMITVGSNATLSDSTKDGQLGGDGTGGVDYEGGTWSIEIDAATVDFDKANSIKVSYSYIVSRDGSSSSGARPGSTGSIYSFQILHEGQHLTFTDNNGATYTGFISEIRSSSGAQNTDINQVGGDETANDTSKLTYYESPLPANGDIIIATFECTGRSAALRNVKIVGTLHGAVAAGNFTSRRLDGTWIEMPGKTGDINGQTETIPITTTVTADTGTGSNGTTTATTATP